MFDDYIICISIPDNVNWFSRWNFCWSILFCWVSFAKKSLRSKLPKCLYILNAWTFKKSFGCKWLHHRTAMSVSPTPSYWSAGRRSVLSVWREWVSPSSTGSVRGNRSTSWHSDAVHLRYRTWERWRRANRSWRVWWKAVVSVIWRIDLKTVGRKNNNNKSSFMGNKYATI